MSKTLKVAFYQVQCPDGITFADVLTKARRKKDEDRTIEVHQKLIRLQDISKSKDNWEGDTIHIRMDEVPPKASIDGELSNIELEDDEGIGEETAFLYNEAIDILALQQNIYGVTEPSFCRYFEKAAQINGPIFLFPVIQSGALQKFTNLHTVKKIEVKLARPKNMKQFAKTDGKSTSDVIEMINNFEAPTANITLSVGRNRKEELNLNSVKNLVKGLLGMNQSGDNVKSIKISGAATGFGSTAIELIEERMIEQFSAEPDEDRRVKYATRKDLIKTAWDNREAELIQQFGGN